MAMDMFAVTAIVTVFVQEAGINGKSNRDAPESPRLL